MSGSTPGNREVAYRLFAAEFDDASYSYSESDEERAPNYVVTPTGARVNRLFATGVLTEVAQAGDSILRARVVDPTGAFVVYAGQYQPEAMSFLDGASTPSFVAVTGKARTFQPDDSDLVYTSVRPESVSEVDAPTRDRWTVTAAERTLERIGVFAAALDSGLTGDALAEALRESGVDASLAAGVPIAIEQYGTTNAYLAALQEVALDAVRLVADETDEVGELALSPGEGSDEPFTPVRPVELDASVGAAGVAGSATDVAEEGTAPESGTPDPAAASEGAEATSDPVDEPSETPVEEGVDGGSEPSGEPVVDPDSGTEEAAEADSASAPASESAAESESTVDQEPTTDTEPETPGTAEAAESAFDEVDEVEGVEDVETPAAGGTETDGVSDEPAFEPDADTGDDEETDAGAYEMDEETRQEVESEFGTDFSTGNEVAPAGEADIDTPDAEPEPAAETPADAESTDASTAPDEPAFEPTGGDETAAEEPTFEETGSGDAGSDEPGGDTETTGDEDDTETADAAADADADAEVDVDTVLVEEMKALDDGDGAPRDELVARVTDRTGADEAAVEDAIQDALMSGQCYEPEDGRLKPI